MNKPLRMVAVLVTVFFGLAATPTQGPAVRNVMREKLVHAQMILEAVVTSNWASLETHSRELERLTRDPRWVVLKYPEYAEHSGAFVKAIQNLTRVATQRDLETSPQAYLDVTLRCVDCHRYIARARIAR
jgi:hypothetical protein